MEQWLYKKNEKPKIFKDAEIEQAIKKGWVDTPAKIEIPKTVKKVVKQPKTED